MCHFIALFSLTNIDLIESVIDSSQNFIHSILVVLEFATRCLNSNIATFSVMNSYIKTRKLRILFELI